MQQSKDQVQNFDSREIPGDHHVRKLDQNDVLMKQSLFFWNKKSIFWFVKDADEIQKKNTLKL